MLLLLPLLSPAVKGDPGLFVDDDTRLESGHYRGLAVALLVTVAAPGAGDDVTYEPSRVLHRGAALEPLHLTLHVRVQGFYSKKQPCY